MKFKILIQSLFGGHVSIILAVITLLLVFTAFHVVRYIFHGFIIAAVVYFIFGRYKPRCYSYSLFYLLMWLICSFCRI